VKSEENQRTSAEECYRDDFATFFDIREKNLLKTAKTMDILER
jgi:hypothetical protein